MPVDFQQVRSQVKLMGARAPQRQAELNARFEKCLYLLHETSTNPQALQNLVTIAAEKNASLRFAIPEKENPEAFIPPPDTCPEATIIAADGSQINPSRHDEDPFAVINTGAIILRPGKGEAPQEWVQTHLLTLDETCTQQGLMTEEMIALQRDVAERHILVELAEKESQPILALTDGTLELYGEPKTDPAFTQYFAEYISALHQLASSGTATAGYVDKPGADLVVRTLELTLLKKNEIDKAGHLHPLSGVSDTAIFSKLIPAGSRSAIFGLQSRSIKEYTAEIALHFFYINVGRKDQPVIARVEIPAWVAENPDNVALVHGILLQQCIQMGSQPYPYLLHRAHEIAVVHFEEKEEIRTMIAMELRKQGLKPGERSMKQANKDISSRTRYAL